MNSNDAAKILGQVLADSYVLLLKTQSVHWNVSGRGFVGIHTLTEQQYNELFAAIDEIAERIRALGYVSPGSLKEFSQITRLTDGVKGTTDEDMVRELVKAHRAMSASLREAIDAIDDLDDDATEDLLIARLQVHDKATWMWSAFLGELQPVKETTVDEAKSEADAKRPSSAKSKKSAAGETAVDEAKEQVAKETKDSKSDRKSDSSGRSAKKSEPEESGRRRLFSGTRVSG